MPEQCEFCGYATHLPCRSEVGAAKCSSNRRTQTATPNLPDLAADPTRWGWHRLLDNYRSSVAEIEQLRAKLRWIADHSNDPAVVRECEE